MGEPEGRSPHIAALVEDRRTELEQLCLRYRVRGLALLGSVTDETFDEGVSDPDLAVEFEHLDAHEHKRSHFGLLFGLEDLFARHVDLVEYAAIRNPILRREALESEVILVGAAWRSRLDPPGEP